MHSCTLRCRKETSYRKDMESVTLVLHVCSNTGPPPPSSSSTGRERKASGPRGASTATARGGSTQQGSQACARVFSFPVVASAGSPPPSSPLCPAPAVTGWLWWWGAVYCFGKSETPVCSAAGSRVSMSVHLGQACRERTHRGHGPRPVGLLWTPGRHRLGER